jgi:hypothetical protein
LTPLEVAFQRLAEDAIPSLHRIQLLRSLHHVRRRPCAEMQISSRIAVETRIATCPPGRLFAMFSLRYGPRFHFRDGATSPEGDVLTANVHCFGNIAAINPGSALHVGTSRHGVAPPPPFSRSCALRQLRAKYGFDLGEGECQGGARLLLQVARQRIVLRHHVSPSPSRCAAPRTMTGRAPAACHPTVAVFSLCGYSQSAIGQAWHRRRSWPRRRERHRAPGRFVNLAVSGTNTRDRLIRKSRCSCLVSASALHSLILPEPRRSQLN